MSDSSITSAPSPVPAPSLTCIRCNYDLAGLAHDGLCPECALPIARSLDASLASTGPRYLGGLITAARFATLSLPLCGVSLILESLVAIHWIWEQGFFGAEFTLRWAAEGLNSIADILWFAASWILTRPNPAINRPRSRRTRRHVRRLVMGIFIVTLLGWFAPYYYWLSKVLFMAREAGCALFYLVLPLYLLRLSERSGHESLLRRSRRLARLVPAFAIPAIVLNAVPYFVPIRVPARANPLLFQLTMTAWRLLPALAILLALVLICLFLRALATHARSLLAAPPAAAPDR